MSELEDALASLRGRFVARCADDLTDLRRWAGEPAPAPADIHPLVHRIAGAAGTFGFADLSERAKRLEDALVVGDFGRGGEISNLLEGLEQLTSGAIQAT